MQQKVTYCENPPLTEVWAFLRGAPALISDSEIGALKHTAQKRMSGLETVPSTVVILGEKDEPAVPFWNSQLSLDNGSSLFRIGHRFLSVHFLKRKGRRYETYEESLRPNLRKWLSVYEETYSGLSGDYAVEQLGFGYTNTFQFPSIDFDLSTYFKMSFNIGVGEGSLLGFKTNFRFLDESSATQVTIEIDAQPAALDDQTVQVVVKIYAERSGAENLSFLKPEQLIRSIEQAKESAKNHFFEFATGKTHRFMGAKYATD